MQTKFQNDIVIHGFRHAIRDRLRNVECPSEMVDQLGGWDSGKVGVNYGEGFKINQLYSQLLKIKLVLI